MSINNIKKLEHLNAITEAFSDKPKKDKPKPIKSKTKGIIIPADTKGKPMEESTKDNPVEEKVEKLTKSEIIIVSIISQMPEAYMAASSQLTMLNNRKSKQLKTQASVSDYQKSSLITK